MMSLRRYSNYLTMSFGALMCLALASMTSQQPVGQDYTRSMPPLPAFYNPEGICPLPIPGMLPREVGHRVTVTAYTNEEQYTDSTPNITASNLKIKPHHYRRIIALSRDLAYGYEFGDRFKLKVEGKSYIVEFQDLMHERHEGKVDLLLSASGKCIEFGVKTGVLIPLKPSRI